MYGMLKATFKECIWLSIHDVMITPKVVVWYDGHHMRQGWGLEAAWELWGLEFLRKLKSKGLWISDSD